MLDFLLDNRSSLLIAVGAAPGALLRLQLSKKFSSYTNSKLNGVLIVNIISTFLLGLFLALQQKIVSLSVNQSLYLLICVGFLGSFSTFSSFIFELYSFDLRNRFFDFLFMIIVSITLGLFSAFLGHYFGNL